MSADDSRDHTTSISPRRTPPRGVLRVFLPEGIVMHELPPGASSVVLGRGRDVDVVVDDRSVSRRHASLHVGGRLLLEDLGSANGTLVDGRFLSASVPTPIAWGEPFEVGDVRAIACLVPRDPDGMARVNALVDTVAPSDLNVLILGETGVGKEVLAQTLHDKSHRAKGPLVRLNCAAVPENLLESELFGFERGAFTGADRSKPGLLEQAHGGSFLLDEIGEMSLTTQAKLLRVTETREVFRLGSVQPRPLDVRFLAATHRDVEALAAEGRFRSDLLFRLRGVVIPVPPLRDRVSEIEGLAKIFLEEECSRAVREPLSLSPEALSLLQSYRWPGNIRELRLVMARAVLFAGRESIVSIDDIDFAVGAQPVLARDQGMGLVPRSLPDLESDRERLSPGNADAERARIIEALQRSAGNQTRAAEILGISRRMLVYRLDALGLPRPRRKSDAPPPLSGTIPSGPMVGGRLGEDSEDED